MTAVMNRPDHVITDVPMSQAAAGYVTGENAADIIACYFTPQLTSPKRDSDGTWHFYGDVAMTVLPTGCVVWIGQREYPETDNPRIDPISGRRMRRARTADTPLPAGFTKSRNGNGSKRRGHRGGHQHPTTVKDLLDRCRAAGLLVEELPNKGGHWKISRPPEWPAPRRATSGCVFVSATTEFRAIAKNTNKILRETGIDVRDIDPAEARRQARRAANRTTEDTEMTATLAAPVEVEMTGTPSDPDVATPSDTQPGEGATTDGGRPVGPKTKAEEINDRLRFVASMRADGHTEAQIAEAMGITANNLAAFLSIMRTRKHPLAVPPLKRYTDPVTGVVTRPGAMVRVEATTRPPMATTTTRTTPAPKTYRRELLPVTEAEVAKLLGAVRNLGKISRTDIVKLFWRRKRRAELDALIDAVVDTGQVRVTSERRSSYGYATTFLEWVAPEADEVAPEVEPEPEQLPETDQVRPSAADIAAVETVALLDRAQVTAEGALAIQEMVAEAEQVEPELPVPAVEVEPEPRPGVVPDTVTEDAPENPAEEPEDYPEVPDDPAHMIDFADYLTAYQEDLDERAAERLAHARALVEAGQMPDSAAQDGPGAPSVVEPVSQTPEDGGEALSGPPYHGQRARYATTCAVCAGGILPGTEIVRARGKWQHVRHLDEPVLAGPAPRVPITAVTVLEAALRRVGVAEPELVARNLRFELGETGWRLRLEATL